MFIQSLAIATLSVSALTLDQPQAPVGQPGSAPAAKPEAAAIPASKPAEPTPPAVGTNAPGDLALQDEDGKPVKVESLWAEKPVVMIFYRGGWCPFCNKSLAEWGAAAAEVEKSGATLVAIAMEKPTEAKATKEKNHLPYRMLVDADGSVCKAYGLIFDLDEKTKKAYEGYGINLATKNANGKWQLPHPGTFAVAKGGKVLFSEAHVDYRTRIKPEPVLAALAK